MASTDMDMSPNWQQGENVLPTRSLPFMNRNGAAAAAAPRRTAGGRSSRRQDRIYQEVMKNMRARGLFLKEESDSDSGQSVTMDDIPDFEEEAVLPSSVANSLLFSLPREIRDRIYSLCLQARDLLPVEWPRPESHRKHNPYNIQTQLLRTCRIIHSESAPLLYTLNNLTFHHPSDSNIFVRALCDTSHGRRITNLSLHVKSSDLRIWMSYLNSTDAHRSLRFDFPNLRELGLRYKSSRWNHANPADHNLKTWIEDPRLDELLDGVRGVYFPYWCTPQEEQARAEEEQELSGFDPANPYPEPEYQHTEDKERNRERYFELRHSRCERARTKNASPIIRICCACRVHPTHFNALTDPAVAYQLQQQQQGLPRPTGVLPDARELPPTPVLEGSAFPSSGFSPIDLQRDVKKLHDPELGSANVSRTPYVARKGVLVALEIHSVDSRRD
ncbi:hypothetical protein Slin15195_G032150 [Septoria linicola]|uniref:F-box domain-containing protein n=1 Tax=Septoria linicola TaxID=215465 RepID=A0A9Q9APW3_9PEZI|nr:hypothetical protein Slin14017_G031170 [Septoria linicola]USW49896.1 hypothetical protein Slin15195_G032150 [Septoria linicola]